MRPFIKIITLFITSGTSALFAETWVRGSVAILEGAGGVTITVPGEEASFQSFEQTAYLPGIFYGRAESGGSILFHTSNGITAAFNGEGVFSVERFEGIIAANAEGEDQLVETQGRMILGLRRGELLVDTRSLTGDSKFVVETPMGRISCVQAILRIEIKHHYRSGIYDFTISSAEGIVRFTDLRQQVYTIYARQRVSGAGSYAAPAIEVGEQMEDIRESFDAFLATLSRLDFKAIDRAKLLSLRRTLPGLKDPSINELSVPTMSSGAKRPRVIEFAPRAENITPFRADIKAPTSYQAELF